MNRKTQKRTSSDYTLKRNNTGSTSFSDREIRKEKEIKSFAEEALENEKNSGNKET